jgi:4a-hydroxytetrahydrobiopterin dehydratase
MSERGRRDFLAADGLEDWVLLHGGAAAVFAAGSLGEAARLAAGDDRLSVRLSRDVWQLEPELIEYARAISAVAREHGTTACRAAVQEVQLAIAAKSEAIDLGFWRAVLGYAAMAEDNAVDPLGHGSTVWMQEIAPAKTLRQAMHIDVSVAREQVEARRAAALAAGGRMVDDSHAPSHGTLSDRAGNRVCICARPDGPALRKDDGA